MDKIMEIPKNLFIFIKAFFANASGDMDWETYIGMSRNAKIKGSLSDLKNHYCVFMCDFAEHIKELAKEIKEKNEITNDLQKKVLVTYITLIGYIHALEGAHVLFPDADLYMEDGYIMHPVNAMVNIYVDLRTMVEITVMLHQYPVNLEKYPIFPKLIYSIPPILDCEMEDIETAKLLEDIE